MPIKDPLTFVQMYGSGVQSIASLGNRRSSQMLIVDDVIDWELDTKDEQPAVEIQCIKRSDCVVKMGTNKLNSSYISVECGLRTGAVVYIKELSIQKLQQFFIGKTKHLVINCELMFNCKLYMEHASNGVYKLSFRKRDIYVPPLFFSSKDMAKLAVYNEKLFIDKMLGI